MTDEQTPLERLQQAVQEFVNSLEDEPCVVTGAVVGWESRRFRDDGELMFAVNYSALPPTSMAATVGILRICEDKVQRDISDNEDDEP